MAAAVVCVRRLVRSLNQEKLNMQMKWDLTPMLKLGVYSPDDLLTRLSSIAEFVQRSHATVSAKVWIDDERWIHIERDAANMGWCALAGSETSSDVAPT